MAAAADRLQQLYQCGLNNGGSLLSTPDITNFIKAVVFRILDVSPKVRIPYIEANAGQQRTNIEDRVKTSLNGTSCGSGELMFVGSDSSTVRVRISGDRLRLNGVERRILSAVERAQLASSALAQTAVFMRSEKFADIRLSHLNTVTFYHDLDLLLRMRAIFGNGTSSSFVIQARSLIDFAARVHKLPPAVKAQIEFQHEISTGRFDIILTLSAKGDRAACKIGCVCINTINANFSVAPVEFLG